jgi:hypothetical protein
VGDTVGTHGFSRLIAYGPLKCEWVSEGGGTFPALPAEAGIHLALIAELYPLPPSFIFEPPGATR